MNMIHYYILKRSYCVRAQCNLLRAICFPIWCPISCKRAMNVSFDNLNLTLKSILSYSSRGFDLSLSILGLGRCCTISNITSTSNDSIIVIKLLYSQNSSDTHMNLEFTVICILHFTYLLLMVTYPRNYLILSDTKTRNINTIWRLTTR